MTDSNVYSTTQIVFPDIDDAQIVTDGNGHIHIGVGRGQHKVTLSFSTSEDAVVYLRALVERISS